MTFRKTLLILSLLLLFLFHPSLTFADSPSIEELAKKVEKSFPWGDRVQVKFEIVPQDPRLKEMFEKGRFDLGMIYLKPQLKLWMESSIPGRNAYLYFDEKGLYESIQTIHEYRFTDLSSIGRAERKDLFQNPLLVSGLFLFYPRHFLTILGEVKKIETSTYEGKGCYILSSPYMQSWYDQKTLYPLKISVRRSPTRGFDFFIKKIETLGEKKFRILMDFQELHSSRSNSVFSSILHLEKRGDFKGSEATPLLDDSVMVRDREPKSIKEYQEILQKDPKNRRALYSMALQYHWSLKHKQCIQILKKIQAFYPRAPQIYYYLLKAYDETGNNHQGDLLIQKAEKQAIPLPSNFYQLAARFYQKQKKSQRAMAIIKSALQKEKTPRLAWQLIHLYLDNPSHHPEALKMIQELINQPSAEPFPDRELQRVCQALQRQKADKTLETLFEIVEKTAPVHKKDPQFHKLMGWIYLQKKDLPKAKEYYREALKLTQEGSWDHLAMAQQFIQMGLVEEGVKELKKMLSGKGSSSVKGGAARSLLNYLVQKRLSKIGPSFSQWGKHLTFHDLENWTYQLTSKLKAEDLEKLIQFWEGEKEKHSGHYYILGNFYTSQKDYQKAFDHYLKSYEILGHLGIIQKVFEMVNKSKDPQLLSKLIQFAEKKKIKGGQNLEFVLLLGKVLLKGGKIKEGISFLKRGAHLALQKNRETSDLGPVLDIAEILASHKESQKESFQIASKVREFLKGRHSSDRHYQRRNLSLILRFYCINGQYEEALKTSVEIQSLGGFWNLYQLVGHLKKANALEGFVNFLKARAQKKGSKGLYLTLGEILETKAQYVEALQWHLKGLQIAPLEQKLLDKFLATLQKSQWALEKADPKVLLHMIDQTEKLLPSLSEKEKVQRVLGKIYYQTGQRPKGLGLLEQSLSESLKKQEANELYLLMNLFYDFKLYEHCFKAAQGVLASSNDQNRWHRTEAQKMLLKIAVYQKNLKILALNLRKNLDGVRPNYEASKILQDLQNQKKGREKILEIAQILEDLLSKSKEAPPIEFLLGELYWMANQKEKGLQWFEKALLAHIGELEKPAYLSRIFSHFLVSPKGEGLLHFEKLLEELQKRELKKKYLKATLTEYQGRIFLKKGKRKEGLKKILQAADLNDYTHYHFILIRFLISHQAYSEGASLAKRILNNPRASRWDKKDARSLLYQSQIGAQDWKSLSQIIVENLKNTTSLYNDSYALFRRFDYGRGEKGKSLEKVIGHLQAYQGPKKGMVSYLMGLLYWEMRKYEKSLESLEISMGAGLGKKNSRLFQKWHSGLSSIKKGKNSLSTKWWDQKLSTTLGALKRVPLDQNLKLAAILILIHLKREKEALPYLDELAKIYRGKGEIALLSQIALGYLKAGAHKKAETMIQEILKNKYLSHYERRNFQNMIFEFWLKSKNFEKLLDHFLGRLEKKSDYYSLRNRLYQIKSSGLEKAFIEAMKGRAEKIGKKATLLYGLFYEYYKYNNYKLSDEYLEKAVKAGGCKENGPLLEKWIQNLQRRRFYYLKKKEVEALAKKVESAQKLYPRDSSLHILLGAIAIHQKDTKKGASHYEKAALGWMESKNYSQALYALEQYLQYGNREKGQSLLKSMIQKPNLPYTYYRSITHRLILFEAREGKIGPLVELCKNLLSRKEGHREVLAYSYEIYKALEKKALLEELVKTFSAEAAKNPKNLYFDFMVYIREKQNKNSEVIQILEGWKKADPKNFHDHQKLGLAYLANKDYTKALALFEELYKKSSPYNRHQYRKNLIKCYGALKDYQKAEALLAEYIKYERGSHRSLLFALEIYRETKQFEKAISTCEKLAAKEYYSSDKIRHWLAIAEIFEEQKEYKKALEIYLWIERLGSKQDAQKAKKARQKLQSRHFK